MSIFDPSVILSSLALGWAVIIVGVFPLKMAFWNVPSSLLLTLKSIGKILAKLFSSHSVIFVALFLFILNMNLAGLLPMVFSPTSHLSFNLSLSLVLWLGMFFWYSNNNLDSMLIHLTPVGSPIVLAPALVMIELISSLIRPITLGLRLMANIMAGHMILTLISSGITSLNILISVPLFSVLIGFMMFEFGVALIQSYVFSSLMALYWEESGSSH